MLSIKDILAKKAAAPVAKTAEAIAAELAANDKAVNYNGLVISRVGVNGLFEQSIVGEDEITVLKSPEKQFFTLFVQGEGVLSDTEGNVLPYIFVSLYELLGVLKQSPMAAFTDAVANNPKLAAILLPGATMNVCAEVAEAGNYTNPFGKDGNVSTLKTNKVIHHIVSLSSSPAAKAAMAAQAAKLAQF